jgi:hypothetical protein
MDPGGRSFADAAAQLIRAGEQETVEALCALSGVQRAFLEEAEDLKRRTSVTPPVLPHRPPAGQPPLPFPWGIPFAQLWLAFCGLAAAAFAFGFWMGARGS